MSQIQKVFLGAVAIAATLGAVQLASGHDLANRWQAVADVPSHRSNYAPNLDASHNVNRAGKADRLAEIRPAPVPTRTVSMRLNDLAELELCAEP